MITDFKKMVLQTLVLLSLLPGVVAFPFDTEWFIPVASGVGGMLVVGIIAFAVYSRRGTSFSDGTMRDRDTALSPRFMTDAGKLQIDLSGAAAPPPLPQPPKSLRHNTYHGDLPPPLPILSDNLTDGLYTNTATFSLPIVVDRPDTLPC